MPLKSVSSHVPFPPSDPIHKESQFNDFLGVTVLNKYWQINRQVLKYMLRNHRSNCHSFKFVS